MSNLPNLYVAKTIEARNPKHEDHAYQLAYFRKAHYTEHTYVPAAKLRELVDRWEAAVPAIRVAPIGEEAMLQGCIEDLAALIMEGEK